MAHLPGVGGERRLPERLEHPVEDRAGLLELRLADLRAQPVGPRHLRRLDGPQRRAALWRDPQQLGAAVGGIVLVDRKAVPHQDVRQALHALAGEVHGARDLGHRRRCGVDRLEHQPARQRLARWLGQRLPGNGEQPDELDDLPRAREASRALALAGPASDRAEGLARAAAGDRAAAEALLRRALDAFGRMGAVFEAALTGERLAAVAASDADAARLRAAALATYERLAAAPHVQRVRAAG